MSKECYTCKQSVNKQKKFYEDVLGIYGESILFLLGNRYRNMIYYNNT